jgi:hypothetical protein
MLKEKKKAFNKKISTDDFVSDVEKDNVKRVYALLRSIFSRDFLKPFWKDIIEFEAFRLDSTALTQSMHTQ